MVINIELFEKDEQQEAKVFYLFSDSAIYYLSAKKDGGLLNYEGIVRVDHPVLMLPEAYKQLRKDVKKKLYEMGYPIKY